MKDLAQHRFSGSIISYPDRGPWGDKRYHGNCSGYVVRDFLATYHPSADALFVDPMEGSGTSRDVAREYGIRYEGFDLREGFDIVRNDLLSRLPAEASSVFVHPPYAAMVEYSKNVWQRPDPADLSTGDVDAFAELLQAALQNVYRALRPGGHYAVLLAPWRKSGSYHHLPQIARNVAPGEIVDELIKVQHNTRSSYRTYSGSFVPIEHETLLVMRRRQDGSIFAMTSDAIQQLTRLHSATWRNLVLGFVRERGEVTLSDLYSEFENHPKSAQNPNYRAKLRQVVQDESAFVKIVKGRYRAA